MSLAHQLLLGSFQAPKYWLLEATDVSWGIESGTGSYYQAFYTIGLYSTTDATGTDLAQGRPASASSVYGGGSYPASNANDGSGGSYWVSSYPSNSPQWWKVLLPDGSVAVNSVKLVSSPVSVPLPPYTTQAKAKSYRLQSSYDNANWTTRATFSTTDIGTEILTLS